METYALPSPLTGKVIEKKLNLIDENAERILTDIDLEGYATKAEVPTKVSQLTNDKKYLTAVPSGYATTSYVDQKIAEAELGGGDVDLTGYATETYVNTEINKAKPDLSSYAKKSDIPDVSDFATENYVDQKIAEAELGGEEVDLSGYATKKYVDDSFNGKEFLPSYGTSNEGQFLRVINGVAAWSTVAEAEGTGF